MIVTTLESLFRDVLHLSEKSCNKSNVRVQKIQMDCRGCNIHVLRFLGSFVFFVKFNLFAIKLLRVA